ncbi:MAG: hypothetical protein KDB75_07130 [Flavobacteriales bacterium]|nr:hypothetical protein [Flavobacteriales bacterium]
MAGTTERSRRPRGTRRGSEKEGEELYDLTTPKWDRYYRRVRRSIRFPRYYRRKENW